MKHIYRAYRQEYEILARMDLMLQRGSLALTPNNHCITRTCSLICKPKTSYIRKIKKPTWLWYVAYMWRSTW